MKTLALLLLSAFLISCGGGEDKDRPVANLPDDDEPSLENQLMSANCSAPNLKRDVTINRKYCGTDDCLILFKDYWWWTNYQFTGPPNWFWNQGQAWSPRNAFVDSEGLHLFVKKDDLGGGMDWMASEVVAVYKADKKTLAGTGYGKYLVSAKVKSAASFDQMDKNVAFGLFTFQNDMSGPPNNPYRELDLAEISKWGVPPCSNAGNKILCEGNAQFAIQIWDKDVSNNVHRYSITAGINHITLVMEWTGERKPVKFKQYNGNYNLDNLPSKASNEWTTKDDSYTNSFIPGDACQLFHMNLWMGNYGEGDKHPGPTNGQPQEVVVTNFQYRK